MSRLIPSMVHISLCILFLGQRLTHTASPLHYLYPRTIVTRDKTEEGESKEIIPQTRVMLVFLDDSETSIRNAITSTCIDALHAIKTENSSLEQSLEPTGLYCILVSRSIIERILQCKLTAKQTGSSLKIILQEMVPQGQNYLSSQPPSFSVSAQGKSFSYVEAVLTAMAENCDLSAWSIFAVNEHLLLLIPQQYEKLTDLQLGIKRNSLVGLDYDASTHILSLKDPKLSNKWQSKALLQQFPVEYVTDKTLEQCFMTKQAYNNDLTKLNQWIFYLAGHGDDNTISSIPSTGFSNLLNFMNTQIVTRLLFISSCHVAGVAFNKKIFSTPHGYSFPIILEGVAEEAAPVGNERSISNSKNFTIRSLYDFNMFSHTVLVEQPVLYADFLQYIINSLNRTFFDSRQYPILQTAGKNTFFPLFASININATAALTRKKPLSIKREWEALKKNHIIINFPFIIVKSKVVEFEIDLRGLVSEFWHNALCRIIFLPNFLNVSIEALRFDDSYTPYNILRETLNILHGRGNKRMGARILIKAIYKGVGTKPILSDIIYLEGNLTSK